MDGGRKPLNLLCMSTSASLHELELELEVYLENLGIMSSPGIAKIPGSVLMAVVDLYLSIDRASCKTVAVGVEGYGFCHVTVAIL